MIFELWNKNFKKFILVSSSKNNLVRISLYKDKFNFKLDAVLWDIVFFISCIIFIAWILVEMIVFSPWLGLLFILPFYMIKKYLNSIDIIDLKYCSICADYDLNKTRLKNADISYSEFIDSLILIIQYKYFSYTVINEKTYNQELCTIISSVVRELDVTNQFDIFNQCKNVILKDYLKNIDFCEEIQISMLLTEGDNNYVR